MHRFHALQHVSTFSHTYIHCGRHRSMDTYICGHWICELEYTCTLVHSSTMLPHVLVLVLLTLVVGTMMLCTPVYRYVHVCSYSSTRAGTCLERVPVLDGVVALDLLVVHRYERRHCQHLSTYSTLSTDPTKYNNSTQKKSGRNWANSP